MGGIAGYLFAALAGMLNTMQSGTNSTLGKSVPPGWSVAIVGCATMLTGLVFAAVTRSPFPRAGALVPWWGWVGGCLGAVFVLSTLLVAKQLGAGAFLATTVTAGVITSLAMDHWGLLGFQQHTASLPRLAGGALMIGGLALIARF
ncbi:DMT family transporter [Sphingomonas bacterium]|uniref:DMT family transporter n=1 Tax=Sphingomonas bacterium TaxID=1895847 RepID=UPI001C2D0701|nr:DMT family transporter [Sphingomonas bacterium]